MRVKRKIIEIDEEKCTGCGQCIIACAEGALEIIDGKAKVIADKFCDGLGACLGECPEDALKIIEREADDFDEAAVEEHLRRQKAKAAPEACGCPSTKVQTLQPAPLVAFSGTGGGPSALSHWPVQIRLVNPEAPFLKNADLLVAADCTPLAYPDFHRDFIAGRVVMIGCPKFDDKEGYERKFTEIFSSAGIKSLTLVMMNVPCCATLRGIIAAALKKSGAEIPVEEVVIAPNGEVVAKGIMGG